MDDLEEDGVTNNLCVQALDDYNDESMEAEEEISPTQNSIVNTACEEYEYWEKDQGFDDNTPHIGGMSSDEEHDSDQNMTDALDVYETTAFFDNTSHIGGMLSDEEHVSNQNMTDALDVYETSAFFKGKYDIFYDYLILIDILIITHFLYP